jgi:membrane protein implicated in regulation of membrane protease activity
VEGPELPKGKRITVVGTEGTVLKVTQETARG